MATLPVVVAGLALKDLIEGEWRSAALIAFTTALFGILLWVADRRAAHATGSVADLTWRAALLVGLAQGLALVPGVSRGSR